MLLFFVWTDTQLINCINTKLHFYRDEAADLIIYKRERISERLVKIVREKEIFSNIYVIGLPYFYKEEEVKKTNKMNSVILHMRLKKYFLSYIENILERKKYKVLFAAAFWSETLNIYRYIRKYNENVRIEIVEEGMANYNGPKNWIFQAAPTGRIKAAMRNFIYCGGIESTARKHVSCFYLYEPELSWMHQGIKAQKLPFIDKNNNPICYHIYDEWQKNIDHSIYNKCRFIYVTDPPSSPKNQYAILEDIIGNMPDIWRDTSIIKLHPLCFYQGKSDIALAEAGIWVDSRKIPVENILFHCEINDKVLIVNQSSALLYLKCMLNKEPYTVFTYRMKPYCEERLIDKFDFFTEKLKEVFIDPHKIIVPETLEEFLAVMKKINKELV